MPKPTTAQLRKINNNFSQTELKEDQVYVFRCIAADTLPVMRYSWYGEYSINMTTKLLKKLKQDYQKGVGLLASHNSNRLPFGRTFDAELSVDDVGGEQVDTLNIDHYMVTHLLDGEGNKVPLKTEVGGMTTQDIANHIEVGHTFDTSIGFSIAKPMCSVCHNDLSDWDECEHIPGRSYTIHDEQGNPKRVRCDIIADDGEGIENSIVYAGAVDRATITRNQLSKNSEHTEVLHNSVKHGESTLYTVNEFKNVPQGEQVFCFLSKGHMEVFTLSSERRDINKFLEEREQQMANEATPQASVTEASAEAVATIDLSQYVPVQEFQRVSGERDTALGQVSTLTEQLATANSQIEQLRVHEATAQAFRNDLVETTIQAGVKARGNSFQTDRFRKYLETLSNDEIKEEQSALKAEFSAPIETAQLTRQEVQFTNADTPAGQAMTEQELRNEAAKVALERHKTNGGDLAELTKQAYAELSAKVSK